MTFPNESFAKQTNSFIKNLNGTGTILYLCPWYEILENTRSSAFKQLSIISNPLCSKSKTSHPVQNLEHLLNHPHNACMPTHQPPWLLDTSVPLVRVHSSLIACHLSTPSPKPNPYLSTTPPNSNNPQVTTHTLHTSAPPTSPEAHLPPSQIPTTFHTCAHIPQISFLHRFTQKKIF